MTISVIIPVFNGGNFIAEAIDSVLNQTTPVDEIIVIDDGSTDNTAQLLRSYSNKIKYLFQNNLGVSAARNTGIRCAKGKYIAFLDHDDIYLPNKIADALSIFTANPQADIVLGKWEYLFSNPIFEEIHRKKIGTTKSTSGVLVGSYVFKKTVFEKIGYFDEELKFAEDVDLMMRINNSNLQVFHSDQLHLKYRSHDSNSTKAAGFEIENQRCTLHMLNKAILAQRNNKK